MAEGSQPGDIPGFGFGSAANAEEEFMERHFEKDLNELKERLLWMGSIAERAVHQGVHAVLDSDEQLAKRVLGAKNLERIRDHATNIAEDVIYIVQGQDVRHPAVDRR